MNENAELNAWHAYVKGSNRLSLSVALQALAHDIMKHDAQPLTNGVTYDDNFEPVIGYLDGDKKFVRLVRNYDDSAN